MTKQKITFALLIASLIIILDQLTKAWIVAHLAEGGEITLIPSFFDIVHARNFGAAFGILSKSSETFRAPFFYIISIIAGFFLLKIASDLPPKPIWNILPIGLIFGGAIGNILDRIFRGSVVDFLSFHIGNKTLTLGSWSLDLYWPAFNVADSGITVGVILLLLTISRQPEQRNI